MLCYKSMRLILYSVCFWNTMQGMDVVKEVLVTIKNAFTKQSTEPKHKNIQQNQYIPVPNETSSEEESSTEEKIEKQGAKSRSLSTPQHYDEEKELKALQQFLNCHKMIASI